jgi:hypothetical protein
MGEQSDMNTSIPVVATVKTINYKAVNDQAGNPVPVAQITLITADLAAANELAWSLGAVATVTFEPSQPVLPGIEKPVTQDGYGQMTLPPDATISVKVPVVRGDADVYRGIAEVDMVPEVGEAESESVLGLCEHGRFRDRGCPDCLDERDVKLDSEWQTRASNVRKATKL